MLHWAYTFINAEGKKDSLKNLAKPHTLCVSKELDGKRVFALFDTVQEFLVEFYRTEEKTFFECIRDKHQKIYFDIDVDTRKHSEIKDFLDMGKNIVVDVIKSSIKVAKEFGVDLVPNDFIIFSSNGPTKISYHIVTHKHKVLNNKLNKLFFEKVMTFVDDRYHQFVDPKMYSSFQQFRMVGSTKAGANRVKRLVTEFKHKDIEIIPKFPKAAKNNKFFYEYCILEMSLITRNDDCKVIPIPLYEPSQSHIAFDSVTLMEEDIVYISNIMGPSFEVRNVEGNLISFARVKTTKCIICRRFHESDNPYVTVINGNIRMHCHRAKNEHKEMGILQSSLKALMPHKPPSLSKSVARSELSTSEYDFIRAFDE